ncbi:MAG TPA: thioesterase family protein [Phycisphaerales bacterium]|nr:thioesterase family protein [Phycisphaerales bacterium]
MTLSDRPHATITIDIPVHWGDMDALGHVNNVLFFRYIESARVAYIAALGLESLRNEGGVGFILQHAECRFRRPVVYPDTLRVGASLESIADDRFTLAHEVFSAQRGEVAAVGRGTIVTYDYARAVKTPIPERVRTAIERLESSRGA